MSAAEITAHGACSVRDAEVQALRLLEDWGLDVIFADPALLIGTEPDPAPGSAGSGLVVEVRLYPLATGFTQVRWRFCSEGSADADAVTLAAELAGLLRERLLLDPAWHLDGDRRGGPDERSLSPP